MAAMEVLCGLSRPAIVPRPTASTRSRMPSACQKDEAVAAAGMGESPGHERGGRADGHVAVSRGQSEDGGQGALNLQ